MTPDAVGFIRGHTTLTTAPLVPEIGLHLASEITPIWQASEAWLTDHDMAPPYWAFAWPGGQALARHILDNPRLVVGRRVLDFASGCGVAAIACAMAGATSVEATEIDTLAVCAITLNAQENNVEIRAIGTDVVGLDGRWDLILCGDVCYEAPMARHIVPWLHKMSEHSEVWIADPGRAYMPTQGVVPFARYVVPTSLELEDNSERAVVLYRVGG